MFVDFFNVLVECLPFEDVYFVAALLTAFVAASITFMFPFGFLFRLGSRSADFFIREVCDTCRMCKEMFLAFLSWLRKKVRR